MIQCVVGRLPNLCVGQIHAVAQTRCQIICRVGQIYAPHQANLLEGALLIREEPPDFFVAYARETSIRRSAERFRDWPG